jgi:hypothetical protein
MPEETHDTETLIRQLDAQLDARLQEMKLELQKEIESKLHQQSDEDDSAHVDYDWRAGP